VVAARAAAARLRVWSAGSEMIVAARIPQGAPMSSACASGLYCDHTRRTL
jgi:galactokinase